MLVASSDDEDHHDHDHDHDDHDDHETTEPGKVSRSKKMALEVTAPALAPTVTQDKENHSANSSAAASDTMEEETVTVTTAVSTASKGKVPAAKVSAKESNVKDKTSAAKVSSAKETTVAKGPIDEEQDDVLNDEDDRAVAKKYVVHISLKLFDMLDRAAAFFTTKEASVLDTVNWKEGDPTPFSALSTTFEAIEGTTKRYVRRAISWFSYSSLLLHLFPPPYTNRLIILEILTKFLVKVIKLSPNDLLTCVYLCINRLGPTWEGAELGIGETILMKAIASATGRALSKIKTDLAEHGDLGKVAQASRSNQATMFQPKPLTIQAVFKSLKEIAAFSGHSVRELLWA